ncbi:methyltransferase [Aestuariibacter sp. AA17]|uniref:Methyltransferase n=1 Tax=Fluctibacter corallii TaxID=2984329 RepID=A0ABT3AC73_9ALTE|nr:methyltransferase [Aestuariibacter sp. AA17]MCV2886272.1 methyltransferase [Aestuariibacter sp. AA17]
MRNRLHTLAKTGIALSLLCALAAPTVLAKDAISEAANSSIRADKERLRDEYRNPQQTLRFFGIKPSMTVVEISPGGGWYSNILAPLLNNDGKLYAAHFHITENTNDYFKKSRNAFEEKVKSQAEYKNVEITSFHPTDALDVAPAGSADAVLTFRNVHNWYMRQGEEGVLNAFKAFNKALKSGGVLGVVEHRLPEGADDEMQKKSGYMKESYVVKLAEKAGFKLVESSDINANPLDTANHPKGVWTLPPRLALDDQDKAKYLAIGESDRMTLKFVKS